MSNIAALIQKLIDSGAKPEVAAIVAAEIFVAGVESAPHRVDVAAERRREKDRERKRNIRGIPQTSADSADTGSQKERSPTPPKEKQLPPEEANASSTPKRSKGFRLPDDWQPSEAAFYFGHEQGFADPSIHSEAARFRDHFHSAAGARGLKVDWDAAFRNWLRKAVEMKAPRPFTVITGKPDGRSNSASDAARRHIENGTTFGPRPGSLLTGADGDVAGLLPQGRREQS